MKVVLHKEPLSMIFNKLIFETFVPREWKRDNITPLFKKGSRAEPGNYRPVSLTSLWVKILEAFLKDNIVCHLVTYTLINDSQHGFLPKRSCLTNLLKFLEYVTSAVDQGKPVQKAFDKVPHERLLSKLKAHGISGHVFFLD